MASRNRTTQILVVLLILSVLSHVVFFLVFKKISPPDSLPIKNHLEIFEAKKQQFPLIGKRRLLEEYDSDLIVNFLPLRQQLQKTVAPYQNDFALYFEYLPTGTTVGVNEDTRFTAASLLKVPVVMAYYHKKERLGITQDPVVTIQKHQVDSYYGDLYKKGAGYKISLDEAVQLTLQESDNTANRILVDSIDEEDFMAVYEGLDIEPAVANDAPVITAQQYASILKSLFFASILSRENSQEILDLMTRTKFRDKLPSGVPENIKVAHKIGLVNEEIYQDCGIVYVPNRSYVLCMVSKSDEETARQRMITVSKMTYDYVSTVKKK